MGGKLPSYHTIHQKSIVLKDVSKSLAHYFSSDRVFLGCTGKQSLRDDIAQSLIVDANLITKLVQQLHPKVPRAIRCYNLGFINSITRNIWSYCNGLEHDGVKEREYVQLLRQEIKTFRKDFKRWRKALMTMDD
ncbi:hypothetical protein [Croceitalea dokdonensis]|uniref:hypothetical protein n=1 Tax=Croceitalea dokdonensis TaxID=346188 RepID=UPI0006CA4956|nr:hypothetical protein [Croceitalea dokdonensis]